LSHPASAEQAANPDLPSGRLPDGLPAKGGQARQKRTSPPQEGRRGCNELILNDLKNPVSFFNIVNIDH